MSGFSLAPTCYHMIRMYPVDALRLIHPTVSAIFLSKVDCQLANGFLRFNASKAVKCPKPPDSHGCSFDKISYTLYVIRYTLYV